MYTSIPLTWTSFTGNPVAYKVGYDTPSSSHTLATVDTKSLTLLVQIRLEARQLYRFWVQAADAAGNWSEKRMIQNVIQL